MADFWKAWKSFYHSAELSSPIFFVLQIILHLYLSIRYFKNASGWIKIFPDLSARLQFEQRTIFRPTETDS